MKSEFNIPDPELMSRYPDLISHKTDPAMMQLVADIDRLASSAKTINPPDDLRTAITDLVEQHRHSELTKPAVEPSRLANLTAVMRSKRRAFQSMAAAVAMLVALVTLTMVAGPSFQMKIHDTAQRFGIVVTDATQVPGAPSADSQRPNAVAASAVVLTTPASGGSASLPVVLAEGTPMMPVSPMEAQQHVPFSIPQPAWLPPGFHFAGATLGAGLSADNGTPPPAVALTYRSDSNPNSGISIQARTGSGSEGYEVPPEAMQDVTVNGEPAVYVHGSWLKPDGQSGPLRWNANTDVSMLLWSRQGVAYVISASATGLNQADLIRIAESLH